jgi:acetyl-CoA carboxylase biotin carboxyl carrier protein
VGPNYLARVFLIDEIITISNLSMKANNDADAAKGGSMELEKLKKFIDFMNENNLYELEIEEEGKRIRLKRAGSEQPMIMAAPQPKEQNIAKEEKNNGAMEIKSPMVGTFYRAPSPGAKPYVEAGDIIKPGDVVCIIEAMKLMNEIKAEVGGKLLRILAENGQPVEFGQTLFVMEAL